jgi:nitroimidazol reductase NimA-like FMN-containing flavoprotein (pyridoxamine 5'-phosphate oxidase superfamily)
MSEVEELSYAQCRSLLGGGVFGRVAVCTDSGPRILPVNYSVVGEAVVLRTTSAGLLASYGVGRTVSFEVDHVDYADQRGWSVLAVGPAEPVEDEETRAHIAHTWEPRPWAGGERKLYLRIPWTELSGRRLGHGWTYANELPVRRRV